MPLIQGTTGPRRIISGGQTGADQAGLRAAKALGYETGGWVPAGWRTDAGPAPWLGEEFGCREHWSGQYAPRTIQNVRDCQAVIWIGDKDSPGGILTIAEAARSKIAVLIIDDRKLQPAIVQVAQFIATQVIDTLMIAGNRERTNPGIGQFVEQVLIEGLKR